MENIILQFYFEVSSQSGDFEKVREVVKKYTPLKTKSSLKENDAGATFICLNIYWDEEYGMHSALTPLKWDSNSIIDPEFDDSFLSFLEETFGFKITKIKEKPLELKPIGDDEFSPDFGFENLFEETFDEAESKAIVAAQEYLLKCGNWTEGGYKECIRDAFTPFANKYKPKDAEKAIETYFNRIITIYGGDKLPDSLSNGIRNGLKSVFKVA